MSYDDRNDSFARAENGLQRFGRWLSRRPGESWVFFFAGIIIAGVLF